jgi:hypothetical protein
MKTFSCTCGQLIFFQNVFCVACKKELAFLPDSVTLSTLEPASNGLFTAASSDGNRLYKKCQNYDRESVCNWMIPEDEPEVFCQSCRLNELIPDLSLEGNHTLWAAMELAKRRLLYSLLSLHLPISNKTHDPEKGLAFRFVSDVVNPDGSVTRALTGHDNGIITLNIAEADNGLREKTRLAMNEPYRTLLGHFRHEIGHYYWDRLVRDAKFIDGFRQIFGDEQANYAESLQTYYANPVPADWQDRYISAYATAHPWEDWAETWAHLLHIYDTLEVANDFGLKGKSIRKGSRLAKKISAAKPGRFDAMIEEWLRLVVVLNSMNRSMGHQDLYPFVLSPRVIEKLRFASEVMTSSALAEPPRQVAATSG